MGGASIPRLVRADCLAALAELADDSVDAIVTDPPAGLEFMGDELSKFATGRVAGYRHEHLEQRHRPSHMGSRLPHPVYGSQVNLQCRRCNRYRFGNDHRNPTCDQRGHDWALDHSTRDSFQAFITAVFEECRRVLKPGGYALVWAFPRVSHWTAGAVENAGLEIRDIVHHHYGTGMPKGRDVSKIMEGPAAQAWRDWSTTLKPATEHWILARRPPSELTVARNLTRHGVGALNIGGARIPREDAGQLGRWPGNLVLSHGAGCDGSGCAPGCPVSLLNSEAAGAGLTGDPPGASSFFYVAKPATSERNLGLGGLSNLHPTVKPLALMRHLCRLITPPGGCVLDPFMGSGTTALAAIQEGFAFIGIERDPAYFGLAQQRTEHALALSQGSATSEGEAA